MSEFYGYDHDFVAEIHATSFQPDFWQEKILDMEGDPVLSNANNFSNYFRGLYIKAEALTPEGSLMYFNFNSSNANIVLYSA